MKALLILKSIVNKTSIKSIGIISVVVLAIYAGFEIKTYFANKDFQDYQRVLAGQLTAKEQALETANKELGTANSKLVAALSDKDTITKAFEKFKKDNALVLKSKDEIIAQLQSQVNDGQSGSITTCIIPSSCVISYDWSDNYGRFKLHDPNILVKNGATFTANQTFILKGQIYKQANGYLEARRVELNEVYKDGDTYKVVPNSSTNIVDSTFQYIDAPISQQHKLLTLRFFGGAGYNFTNRIGVVAGLEMLNYKNVGLITNTYFDTTTIKNTELGAGLDYNLHLFGTPLNIAPYVSIQTPFNSFFGKADVSLGLIFFID